MWQWIKLLLTKLWYRCYSTWSRWVFGWESLHGHTTCCETVTHPNAPSQTPRLREGFMVMSKVQPKVIFIPIPSPLPHMHTCMIQTVISIRPLVCTAPLACHTCVTLLTRQSSAYVPLCVQPLPPGLSYLCDSVDQTVISVRPLVCAAPSLWPVIPV